jgi:two-component system sensor histidine kinase/response regulator
MKPETSTLLIVDDNMNNIQVLASMLTNNGFNVEFATNGPDALHWVEEENFDLILLDVMMPQMDGFEVCEKIKANKKFHDLPIIFLTAKTDKESVVKGFLKGGNDYLTKPFDQSELLARVNTHLEIKKNRDKLSEINKWLERMVAERTKELNNALDHVNQLNSKLLQLDEVKSEFLKMISHEIRTPLNGILGFTDIIKKANEAEPLREFIDLLEQSAFRLERLSLNALLLTTLKVESYSLNISHTGIAILLEEEVGKLRNKTLDKQITIRVEPGEPLTIKADEDLFRNAAHIIIDNAIRYSPDFGTITIKSKQSGNFVHISVIDQGPGFNSKALKTLYESFSMGEQHFDQKLGLGMALAKQIMLAHKGNIKVNNLPEGGACVTLMLPV